MSVGYTVRHTTKFVYPVPVSVCHNIVCLSPRPDPRLRINSAAITITPQPTVVTERVDPFGNITHAFSIEEPHDSLMVSAVVDVVVNHQPIAEEDLPWATVAASVANQTDSGWFGVDPFLYDSPLVSRSSEAEQLAAASFSPGRPIEEAALALTQSTHELFDYQPGATHVDTTSSEALRERRGVCQDFAHAMIAVLRSIGVPARYVSGYLRTIPPEGRPRLIGVDQSHAWVAIYCGSARGWVEFDPTNAMRCSVDHIPLAVGRDYTDVAPIRGAFLGGGDSRLVVTVDVEQKPVETPPESHARV